ncbi:MAG TPA: glycosyltransferase family 4 protein [Geminicoccaceae bacterium]
MNDILLKPQVQGAVTGQADGPRVLQVLPELEEGGVERGTLDIASFLAGEGWTPLVASSGGLAEEALAERGIATFRLPLAHKNPLVIRRNVRRLQRLIQDQAIDLVHARSRAPAWSAYYATRRCRVPFVTTFHGVYGGSERWLKRRYNAIMARGDRVIAISEHVADHVRMTFRVGPDRLRVIRRGVDLDEFDPARIGAAELAELAERWRIPPGAKVVMLPGRVTRIKGHLLLLRALERLDRDDVHCVMVGGAEPRSSYVSEVEGLAGATGLRDRVRMVGSTGDMASALMLADVVVVPSIGPEAFGRVSVEAQAMGRPVIVSDIGGLGETLMPAATGWLVPPGDVSALASALELALAMPEDARERLARRARRFVMRSFSVEQMARRTLAVYRELLEAAPDQAPSPARRRRANDA